MLSPRALNGRRLAALDVYGCRGGQRARQQCAIASTSAVLPASPWSGVMVWTASPSSVTRANALQCMQPAVRCRWSAMGWPPCLDATLRQRQRSL